MAENVLRAILADTPSYVQVAVDGPLLRIHLEARSASSARETLEDLLACIQVAERTLGVKATSSL